MFWDTLRQSKLQFRFNLRCSSYLNHETPIPIQLPFYNVLASKACKGRAFLLGKSQGFANYPKELLQEKKTYLDPERKGRYTCTNMADEAKEILDNENVSTERLSL